MTILMAEEYSWYQDQLRRRALADLKIAAEISKHRALHSAHVEPEDNPGNHPTPTIARPHPCQPPPNAESPSVAMMLFGAMLSLTSVMLVSFCLIWTISSYDRVLGQDEGINGDPMSFTRIAGGPLPAGTSNNRFLQQGGLAFKHLGHYPFANSGAVTYHFVHRPYIRFREKEGLKF